MPVPLHLITVIGGRISTLGHMLDHYLRLNVDSIELYVHTNERGDPLFEQVRDIARSRGVNVAGHLVGEWSQIQYSLLSQISSAPQDAWYLIADQDEFQHYQEDVKAVIDDCSHRGFTYVRGCLVDRFSPDGILAPIDNDATLADQFPIGSFFTSPVLGGNPMKIVAARGGTAFSDYGHHRASNGVGCPPHLHFIQVHHFKWTDGLMQYLGVRSSMHLDRSAVKREDIIFARYYEHHGSVINLADPGILAAPCLPNYSQWNTVRAICATFDTRRNTGLLCESLGR